MSSSLSGYNISDYTIDVQMELSALFYPPPEVRLEENVLYPLEALNEDYSFDAEKRAVADYEANEKRKELESEKTVESVAKVQQPHLSNGILQPQLAPMANGILQPQQAERPVGSRTVEQTENRSQVQRLRLEDFEASAASPFDFLEIKTIDEHRVLREILDLDSARLSRSADTNLLSQGPVSRPDSVPISALHSNSALVSYSASPVQRPDSTNSSSSNLLEQSLKPSKSSPDLTVISDFQSLNLSNDDQFEEMSEWERVLVVRVSGMGFAPSQVLRCLRKLRPTDEKQLVHCLLLVQSLSRNGCSSDIVEEAVISADLDDDKARKFVRAAHQLRNLGFDNSRIFPALKLCQGSRDQALDYLLSH